MARPPSPRPPIPRYAGRFVACFLAAVTLCPLTGINAWPFSTWRLFSALRSSRQVSWQAQAVDSSGTERALTVTSTSPGYGGLDHILSRFASGPANRRDAICHGLLQTATERFGPSTVAVRIYRLLWRLSDRVGDRSRPPERTPAWVCQPEGARAA